METDLRRSPIRGPFGLSHDSWGRLVLIDSTGERFVNVVPIRLFPITSPDQLISICDAHGHELTSIADIKTLSPTSQQALDEELSRREFVPVIERIIHVSSNSEPSEWTVDTNRGRTKFILKTEDDIRRLGDYGVLIFDAHSIRYLIPDERTLDVESKRVIEWYV